VASAAGTHATAPLRAWRHCGLQGHRRDPHAACPQATTFDHWSGRFYRRDPALRPRMPACGYRTRALRDRAARGARDRGEM